MHHSMKVTCPKSERLESAALCCVVTGFALGALCFLINLEEMLIIIFQQCPGSHMHAAEKESEIITRERASERTKERRSLHTYSE
jgi:hypothetical protein